MVQMILLEDRLLLRRLFLCRSDSERLTGHSLEIPPLFAELLLLGSLQVQPAKETGLVEKKAETLETGTDVKVKRGIGSRRKTGPGKEKEREKEKRAGIMIVKEAVEGVGMIGIETMAGSILGTETVNGTEQGLEIVDMGEKMTGPGTGGETGVPTGIEKRNEGITVTGAVVAALCLMVEIVTDPEVPHELLQRQVTSRSCWMYTEMRATLRVRMLLTVVSIQKRQLMMMSFTLVARDGGSSWLGS